MKNEKIKNILIDVLCVIIAIILTLLFRYFISVPTQIQQISMKPTLEQDQRLWLSRWNRTTKTLPKRGEIITFEEPSKKFFSEEEINLNYPVAKYVERHGWDWFVNNFLEVGSKRSYIKRVIALPGEYVEIKDGMVYINGSVLQEDYLQPGVVTDILGVGFNNFVVPQNCVFAMGDNRSHSTDCRTFGCIPLEKIESTVAFKFWPFDKFGNA